MKKIALFSFFLLSFFFVHSQGRNHWKENNAPDRVKTHKSVARASFPKTFKVFDLDVPAFTQDLMSIVGRGRAADKVRVSFPNADGGIEEFELVEASNFEPALQERFPNIRAYSGRGITDPYATIKVSLSPEGIQTMTFRADKENEFIEQFSEANKSYAVFRSQRKPGALPWNCSTPAEQRMVSSINDQVLSTNVSIMSSGETLKTLRLAQSCNGEYANYFGAFSSVDESKVMAAFNATLTRCNGVYEKDLALHLNLIKETSKVIFYDPLTDPYSTSLSSWNKTLESTLVANIGENLYDIGHMFGASGGGGNAGCIGCICVNRTSTSNGKGSGITSPADSIPRGDNFDIDYVAHEVGHQLGANHTFSMSNEGTGVNKEVGSGITIMGYAGITAQDVAPHSIDIFHQTSIDQIQKNINTKTCPVTTSIFANNQTPKVGALKNYTIPISTPFALTGSATDNDNDPITYCWEQNDNASNLQTGPSSVASALKASGPNWISYSPSSSPTRIFPKLSTILAGSNVSGPLTGGDAGANTEALSSVNRTLNFRLTVRDNAPFSSTIPVVGQTNFADVVITVSNSGGGPFSISTQNSSVSYAALSTQTIKWNVNKTNISPFNATNVKISFSTDGGQTFPHTLAVSTPNDGSQSVVMPDVVTTLGRIKVEAIGNIFFDINNANVTINNPKCSNPTGLTTSNITNKSASISWSAVTNAISYNVEYKTSVATTWTTLSLSQKNTTSTLSGLNSSTVYQWRVRATCSVGVSNYVQSANFTTACYSDFDAVGVNNNSTTTAVTIPLSTNIRGRIDVGSDNDFFKIVLNNAGTIQLTLTTLPANYNLQLLNSLGGIITTSEQSGSINESITASVGATTYYARVYPSASTIFNANSCYTLKVIPSNGASRIDPATSFNLNKLNVLNSEVSIGNSVAFPNPVKNILNLSMTAEGNDVILLNSMGAMVKKSKAFGSFTQINVSDLPAGLYLVKILKQGRLVQQIKVIKE